MNISQSLGVILVVEDELARERRNRGSATRCGLGGT